MLYDIRVATMSLVTNKLLPETCIRDVIGGIPYIQHEFVTPVFDAPRRFHSTSNAPLHRNNLSLSMFHHWSERRPSKFYANYIPLAIAQNLIKNQYTLTSPSVELGEVKKLS